MVSNATLRWRRMRMVKRPESTVIRSTPGFYSGVEDILSRSNLHANFGGGCTKGVSLCMGFSMLPWMHLRCGCLQLKFSDKKQLNNWQYDQSMWFVIPNHTHSLTCRHISTWNINNDFILGLYLFVPLASEHLRSVLTPEAIAARSDFMKPPKQTVF